MALETSIIEIKTRLADGKFPNAQAISQGIVLRLLQELGWDTWDPAIVWPEYQTGEGRADFALCHPPGKPAILIEVKQPGKAEDSVRQALEYSFHTGAPFVLLTDGRTWSFYLPAEQGSYEDRRVYKLDLLERTPPESADTLRRYLAHDAVASEDALNSARKEYQSRFRRDRAVKAIPTVWRDLVEKGNEELVELLASNVELKVGIRPGTDDVALFLENLSQAVNGSRVTKPPNQPETSVIPARATSYPVERQVPPRVQGETTRSGHLTLQGKIHPYANAKDAMIIVLRELAYQDAHFLEKCAAHPDAQGRKRRYIARTPEELYPDREDLRELREDLPGGWLVATNLNNVLKRTIIKLAAEVAGLKFGKDVIIDFPWTNAL